MHGKLRNGAISAAQGLSPNRRSSLYEHDDEYTYNPILINL